MMNVKIISYSQPPAGSELSDDLLQMVAYEERPNPDGVKF